MANIYDKEIERMQSLINFGAANVNESKGVKPVVEYKAQAADGNTYGIIRECSKYYIKYCPAKDTEVLAEDFDYIGGEMNKKANEYNSYANASKHFGMKMKMIREAYQNGTKVLMETKTVAPAEWQIQETKEMRDAINRCNEIVNNVGHIMNEGNEFTMKHTLPEAPASNPSAKQVNAPFVETGVAEGDKDFTKTSSDHKKAAPFDKEAKVDMESDANPKGNSGDVYSEKAKFDPENNIASKAPKGGKAVKMNEGRRVKITEAQAQALAWSDDEDYMDTSNGTEVGDSHPFDEEIGEPMAKQDVAECNVHEAQVPVEDVAGQPDDVEYELELDEPNAKSSALRDMADDDMDDEFDYDLDGNLDLGDDDFDDYGSPWEDDYLDDGYNGGMLYCNRNRKGRRLQEANDFGKHPAYRKVPMSGSARGGKKTFGKEWDDESVANEEPFGKKVGSSYPFTEVPVAKLADIITKKVAEAVKRSKKKI